MSRAAAGHGPCEGEPPLEDEGRRGVGLEAHGGVVFDEFKALDGNPRHRRDTGGRGGGAHWSESGGIGGCSEPHEGACCAEQGHAAREATRDSPRPAAAARGVKGQASVLGATKRRGGATCRLDGALRHLQRRHGAGR